MFPEGRLFDFVIVGVVALIVVGPKDLPILMRKAGQFMARVRGMAAEFRASFDELARQSELDELRKEVNALRTARPLDVVASAARNAGVGDVFTDIHSSLGETTALANQPVMTALPTASTITPEPAVAAPEPAPPEPTPPDAPAPKPKRVRKPKAATP
jgi:sec-independent protein translocase protein TatB